MKKSIKITLFCFIALSASIWTYYYTDLFYHKTEISISKNKSEVLITKLTTKKEIEIITGKFESIGVRFKINSVTYSDNKLTSINFNIEAPNGAKGNYTSNSMRLTREFKIIIDNTIKAKFMFGIG